jgi:hypothetical protein
MCWLRTYCPDLVVRELCLALVHHGHADKTLVGCDTKTALNVDFSGHLVFVKIKAGEVVRCTDLLVSDEIALKYPVQ